MLKRIIAIVLLCGLTMIMTACATKPYTCDLCMKEQTSKKHTAEMLGDKVTVCDECYKEINALIGN